VGITCNGPILEDTGAAVCPYDPGETAFDCQNCWLEVAQEEAVKEEVKPNPGSDLAVGQGCLCSTSQNNQGMGFSLPGDASPSFVTSANCPLHGWKEEELPPIPTTEDWGE
jgi:hypothetical protein